MLRASSRQRTTGLLGVLILLAGSVVAEAQPTISATSGAWSHKATVTITGSSFGAKAVAAPTVWDDASGANILDKWSGAWPNSGAYNLTYRAPQRGIGLPHGNITRYIAGGHGSGGGPQGGYNVILFKTRTIANPSYTYATWYQRVDDAWVFGGDDNFKTFAYSTGNSPYELPNNWYAEYNPRPTSRTSGAAYHLNDDATGTSQQSLQTPDQNGHSWWWNGAVNPMSGSWTKVEMELKYTSGTDGYIRLWENGVLKINYAGPTDKLAGSTRTEGIGGYARNYNQPNNWRYFADVYLDYSRARVILGNAATFAASTVREVQIPSSWSSSSITVGVNLGKFAAGQTAYVYVVDSNGVVNANGRAVTIGSSAPPPPSDTTAPTTTMATPANGSTVSATATVSANASDNVGVAGVQFRLDGANLGAEDTTAPYSVSWNTTTATNGAHILTAVARDAAGNQATSSGVTVTVSNTTAPPPPPNQTAGLVAAYAFNAGAGATAADTSEKQNTGTISGAQWVAEGRYGAALRFDGVDDIVRVTDAASLDLTSGMTLEAWVRPTALSGWRTVIMKEVGGGLAYTLYAHDDAPKPAAYVRIAGKSASDAASGTAGLPLNTWSHLAATYDGTTLRLFVNGAQVASRPVTGSIVTSSNPLNVGGNSVWGEYFAGLIDEVRIYSRALTAAEIQADMSAPIGGGSTSAPKAPTNVRIVQ
jgi:hypothetical protein